MVNIKNISRSNGYDLALIDKLVHKLTYKCITTATSFNTITTSEKLAVIPFEPRYTTGLESIFRQYGLETAHASYTSSIVRKNERWTI